MKDELDRLNALAIWDFREAVAVRVETTYYFDRGA